MSEATEAVRACLDAIARALPDWGASYVAGAERSAIVVENRAAQDAGWPRSALEIEFPNGKEPTNPGLIARHFEGWVADKAEGTQCLH